MGTLLLIRHGQASFGAADYDQLSALGQRQCQRLGEHLHARGLQPVACYTGTLRRQQQSLQALAQGLPGLPAPQVLPALDEYDSEAVVRALHPELPTPPDDPAQAFRHHFRLLRDGLAAWMDGRVQPLGMPAHADFKAGIAQVLDRVRAGPDGTVIAVSSGGPISTAVGLVLGLAPDKVVDLNLRIRNSALTEFEFNPKRQLLISFNGVPHLEHAPGPGWVTYA